MCGWSQALLSVRNAPPPNPLAPALVTHVQNGEAELDGQVAPTLAAPDSFFFFFVNPDCISGGS